MAKQGGVVFQTNGNGKVDLVNRSTGEAREAWAVDAYELLATGEFDLAGGEGVVEVSPATLARHKELHTMNVADLHKILKAMGHKPSGNKKDVIARIMELDAVPDPEPDADPDGEE
jgi:hypothetical protein